jgi:hypothetical protein
MKISNENRDLIGIIGLGLSVIVFGWYGLFSLIVILPFVGWNDRYKGPIKIPNPKREFIQTDGLHATDLHLNSIEFPISIAINETIKIFTSLPTSEGLELKSKVEIFAFALIYYEKVKLRQKFDSETLEYLASSLAKKEFDKTWGIDIIDCYTKRSDEYGSLIDFEFIEFVNDRNKTGGPHFAFAELYNNAFDRDETPPVLEILMRCEDLMEAYKMIHLLPKSKLG